MSETARTPEVERAITLFLDALRKDYAVDEVRLYDSRARGDFRPDSDVDLAVPGKGLIAAFSMYLVKPGLFPAEPGKAIQRAQSVRQVADYEALPVPHDDAAGTVRAAESFVATAVALVATS